MHTPLLRPCQCLAAYIGRHGTADGQERGATGRTRMRMRMGMGRRKMLSFESAERPVTFSFVGAAGGWMIL